MSAAEMISQAVGLALQIAADNRHGYDQSSRWGPDFDCSSFLIWVWEQIGVLVKTAGATYTGNMKPAFLRCGFEDVTDKVNLLTGAGLQAGDILLNYAKHVAMYIGNGLIVHAAGNENGGATGGQTGDQTGREICTQGYYYSPSAPWECVLRYTKEPEAAPDPPAETPKTYTVTANDSLWKIAAEQLGDPNRWHEIQELNGLTGTVIYPGQVLKLPGSKMDHEPEPEPEPPLILDECTVKLPVLTEGSSGAAVGSLQVLLIVAGCDVGPDGADGDFGHNTWMALCDFQRRSGIPTTGKADAQTWALLIG